MSALDRLSDILRHGNFRKQPGPRKPVILSGTNIEAVAEYIKSDKCKDVFFMVGAGISTSAGIPDFRSPDTGLYANLAKLDLPYPEAVFDISYFRKHPKPFYTLAAELYPGYYRPTVTHSFMKLLAEKGKLHTVFTQNIDTLERMAGVPSDKIFEAHGSFATQHCIRCGAEYPDNEMDEHVKTAKVPRCKHKACTGLVKPDIVFFGEGLPDGFRDASLSLAYADLLIIMGTSLSVYPFAGLRDVVPDTCPRILINLDRVGDIGSRADDLVFQLTCDEAVRKLSDALGWREQLEKLWEATATSYTPRITKQPAPTTAVPESIKAATPLEDEVAELAKKLEKKMNVTDEETSFSVEASEEKPDDDVNEGGKVEVEPAEASGKPALVDTPHYEGGIKSVPQTKVEAKDKDAESGPSIAVA